MKKPDETNSDVNSATKGSEKICNCNWSHYESLYVTYFSLVPVLNACIMAPVLIWRMSLLPVGPDTVCAIMALSALCTVLLIWTYVWWRRIRPALTCKGSSDPSQHFVFVSFVFFATLVIPMSYWNEPIFVVISGLCRNAVMIAFFVGFRFIERYATYYQYYGKRSKVGFIEWCNLPKRS